MGTNCPKLIRDNKLDIQEGQRTQSQVNTKHRQHPVGAKFPPASAQSRAMNVLQTERRGTRERKSGILGVTGENVNSTGRSGLPESMADRPRG